MKPQPNHLFISNVRFWSMLAIVFIHAVSQWDVPVNYLTGTSDLKLILCQCLKFGSIAFFVISGFLLGGRIDQTPALQYFNRRWRKIGAPWLFWAFSFSLVGIITLDIPVEHRLFLDAIPHRTLQTLFFSIYWFVPNALLSLGVLLLFRRYLDSKIFGGILMCVSLFYGINVHTQWLPGQHTADLGAFVFYLWLGNWAHRHYRQIAAFLERTSFAVLWCGIVVSGSIALLETVILIRHGSEVSQSTIRISNQIFSVLVVLLLGKSNPTWPEFINVREETFGIYLIHPFMLIVAKSLIGLAHKLGTGLDATG